MPNPVAKPDPNRISLQQLEKYNSYEMEKMGSLGRVLRRSARYMAGVAGLCLLTPGLITDAIGFLCLVPPLRLALIEKGFIKSFHTASATRVYTDSSFPPHPHQQRQQPARPPQGQIIDGEFRREDD